MAGKKPEIILTNDGSHSLRHPELNETYHSQHGAIRESMHVFIKAGLMYYIENHSPNEITIGEVGFGTGLNAWLSLAFSRQYGIKILYETFEPYPVPPELAKQLNYADSITDREIFMKLHQSPWEKPVFITENFILYKTKSPIENAEVISKWDVLFFDAFSPGKQPGLWTPDIIKKMYLALRPGGIFVTYSAKGAVRRSMAEAGFRVEKLPGPPGKRQMLRGIKTE